MKQRRRTPALSTLSTGLYTTVQDLEATLGGTESEAITWLTQLSDEFGKLGQQKLVTNRTRVQRGRARGE